MLGGCAANRGQTSASANTLLGPIPPIDAGRGWYASSSPIQPIYQEVYDLNRAFSNSYGEKVQECMSEVGFVFQPAMAIEQTLQFTRYGLLPGDDPVYVPPRASAASDLSLNGNTTADNSDAYTVALFGSLSNEAPRNEVKTAAGQVVGFTTAAGGCVGKAESAIFGDQNNYAKFAGGLMLIQTALNEATDKLWNSAVAQDAIKSWQDCLEDAGIEPPNSLGGLIERDWNPDQIEIQQQTANADIACKRTTNVVAAVFKLDWSLQRDFIESNQVLVDSLRTWHESVD